MRIVASVRPQLYALALAVAATINCYGEQDFPYVAFVDDNSAIVRSGPGTQFYATESLDWAARVEVYQHEDDQWAAIRPTARSYSWIPASAVEIGDEPDLGVVVESVKTVIGSRLNDRSDVEYVTLDPEDVVEILGQAELDLGNGGPESCYKILPPAGEFRWIRRSQLSLSPPVKSDGPMLTIREPTRVSIEDDISDESVAFNPIALSNYEEEESESGAIATIQFEAETAPPLQLAPSNDSADAPLDLLEPPALSDVEMNVPEPFVPRSAGSIQSDQSNPTDGVPLTAPPLSQSFTGPTSPSQINQSQPSIPAGPVGSSGVDFGLPGEGELIERPGYEPAARNGRMPRMPLGPVGRLKLGQELLDIEIQLTQQVAQPPETWQLEDLHVRAQAVIDTSDEADHRATGQRVLAKIAQLRDVKRRHEGLLSEQQRLARRTPGSNATRYAYRDLGPIAGSRFGSTQQLASADKQYDGVGWLMPVVTDHPSIPRYVLTDSEGNIKQFVSPKPGLNLNRFEQKKIAIYGQKGFLPTYEQPHLMAERIISLDKLR